MATKTTTKTEVTILTPGAIENLLGDTRAQFVEIVTHLPAKLRNDYMREAGFAKEMITRGPTSEYLRQCHPKSLMAAFVNSASLGLTLNPIKKHCTIIARWNREEKIYEASNLIMFQGLTFLATQAGVRDIVVDVVYQADKFSMKRTHEGDHYEHEINFTTQRGVAGNEFVGVYVAAKMPGSTFPKVEWIPKEDIWKMREQSDSYLDKEGKERPNSPWVKWFDEMAKKGGIKRAQKRWEELVEANENWNVFKKAVEVDTQSDLKAQPLEGEGYEMISTDQATVIKDAIKDANMAKPSMILDAYKVDSIEKLPAANYEEILERIKSFGEKKREKTTKTKPAAEKK
jgi:phage RecT family recombinase